MRPQLFSITLIVLCFLSWQPSIVAKTFHKSSSPQKFYIYTYQDNFNTCENIKDEVFQNLRAVNWADSLTGVCYKDVDDDYKIELNFRPSKKFKIHANINKFSVFHQGIFANLAECENQLPDYSKRYAAALKGRLLTTFCQKGRNPYSDLPYLLVSYVVSDEEDLRSFSHTTLISGELLTSQDDTVTYMKTKMRLLGLEVPEVILDKDHLFSRLMIRGVTANRDRIYYEKNSEKYFLSAEDCLKARKEQMDDFAKDLKFLGSICSVSSQHDVEVFYLNSFSKK